MSVFAHALQLFYDPPTLPKVHLPPSKPDGRSTMDICRDYLAEVEWATTAHIVAETGCNSKRISNAMRCLVNSGEAQRREIPRGNRAKGQIYYEYATAATSLSPRRIAVASILG